MEYQVPQFIEVEDKIVGPLTLKQFIYLAGGAGFAVLTFFYLHWLLWAVLAIPVVALAVALAFYKVNGKTFSEMLEAGFTYYVSAKLFLWKKEDKKITDEPGVESASATKVPASKLTSGKLHELAWSLDVKNDAQS